MADDATDEAPEPQKPTNDPDPTTGDQLDHGPDSADTEPDDLPGETDTIRFRRRICNEVNATMLGELTIHYPERDVVLIADGDAAMRMLAAFERRDRAGLGDRLSPTVSNAGDAWVVADFVHPLAMSWLPGLPSNRSRIAVDPIPFDRAAA